LDDRLIFHDNRKAQKETTMIVASTALAPECRKNRADLLFETTQELAELPLPRSDAPLPVLFADADRHTRPQVLDVEEPAPEREAAACAVRPLRVLLVDDNRYVAELLAVLLRLDGHDVQIARDGLTALEFVPAYRPEVVLLDIELPGMSGYEVACRLRAREDTKHIFLAAVTGYGLKDDRDQSREAGFDCHLVKPVEPTMLRRLLALAATGEK
jgi:CheY-like chemotaxis protein